MKLTGTAKSHKGGRAFIYIGLNVVARTAGLRPLEFEFELVKD